MASLIIKSVPHDICDISLICIYMYSLYVGSSASKSLSLDFNFIVCTVKTGSLLWSYISNLDEILCAHFLRNVVCQYVKKRNETFSKWLHFEVIQY